MKNLLATATALALTVPALAQEAEPEGAPSPNAIVEAAPPSEWVSIPAEDLLVMTLSPDRDGNARQVVMQLMPAPISQGWVENIRTLARAGWYDGISVNRVQDNYVVQWGDPNVDNPEAEGEPKPLPEGLLTPAESEYRVTADKNMRRQFGETLSAASKALIAREEIRSLTETPDYMRGLQRTVIRSDPYSLINFHTDGWPVGVDLDGEDFDYWPVHCYGMVGVGRSYSPDTGTGAELYTVIGHAPRHLDRNIALVGRVIEGIEHLSSLPRGTGPLGFYETTEERVPIASIRVVSDLPDRERSAFEYLATDSETFARYADARANRRDPFFIEPAGGADICNIPVPVRRVVESASD